jgi:hypothetical protein
MLSMYAAVPDVMLADPFISTITAPFHSAYRSFNYEFGHFCGGSPAAARCVPPRAIVNPLMQAAHALVNDAPRDKACVMVVGLLSHLSMFQQLRDANETIRSALSHLRALPLPCRILLRTAELPKAYDVKDGVSIPPRQHADYEQLWGKGKLRMGLRRSLMLNEIARQAAADAGVEVLEGEAFTAAALHLNADNLHPYCRVSSARGVACRRLEFAALVVVSYIMIAGGAQHAATAKVTGLSRPPSLTAHAACSHRMGSSLAQEAVRALLLHLCA